MGAASAIEEETIQPTAVEVEPQPEAATPLFKFATWIHVGAGALSCEDVNEEKGEVSCSNPLHFHAWCRLPNQFQHKEIRDRAMAAKARKTRQMRDPDSDAGAVLDEAIDAARRAGERDEAGKAAIVDELLTRDWHQEYREARREVDEERLDDAGGDDEPPLKWEHIERDKARRAELSQLPEDRRSADEYEELGKHVDAYDKAVEAAYEQRMKPLREAHMGRSVDDLANDLRELRIDVEANHEFMHFYAANEWVECTLEKPNGARRFQTLDQLSAAADEVIGAIEVAFDDLERGRAEGNL